MSVKVIRTSIFPAPAETVFAMLQELSTLQKVASPWASFTPLQTGQPIQWKEGADYDFRIHLFSLVPFGTHHIHVVRFSPGEGIYTRERNEHVPVWNHEILLRVMDGRHCSYTDQVEIDAGWKTPLVQIWANRFYAHRQHRWTRLLNKAKIG